MKQMPSPREVPEAAFAEIRLAHPTPTTQIDHASEHIARDADPAQDGLLLEAGLSLQNGDELRRALPVGGRGIDLASRGHAFGRWTIYGSES